MDTKFMYPLNISSKLGYSNTLNYSKTYIIRYKNVYPKSYGI